MNRTVLRGLAAIVAVALIAPNAPGQRIFQPKGNIIKYEQPLGHFVEPPNMMLWGEDIWSDVDWNKIMQSPTLMPNWVIADDFRDEFSTPVRTVKWWGSYFPQPTVFQQTAGGLIPVPPGPGVEDGFVISFFGDLPAGPSPTNPDPFSKPDGLLGTYVLPIDRVHITPTGLLGWDMQPIYEYEANLMDAHLDHALSPIADPMGFNQRPGDIYWISILAEVGHRLRLETIPGTTEQVWISEDTGKIAENHFWGWHTSPIHFNDVATMGHLFMPGNDWQYGQWMPIQPQHGLFDMAFQLKTIPEPATLLLVALGAVVLGVRRGRR
jgi:hypothetical protein